MPNEFLCPFCKNTPASYKNRSSDVYEVVCRTCGTFDVTHEFCACSEFVDGNIVLQRRGESSKYPLYVVRGAIKEYNLRGQNPFIGWDDTRTHSFISLEELLNSVQIPQTPFEKLDKLLLNLEIDTQGRVGSTISLQYNLCQNLCYARDFDESLFVLRSADRVGYFDSVSFTTAGCRFILSLKAWQRIEELKTSNLASRQGFIACWFSDPPNPHNQAIVSGIENAGFKPLLLQGKHFPETIISKALGEIKKSRFVIVDLTEQRKSVFFEAGYALGRGIDVIFVIEKSYWDEYKADLEFYVKNYNIKAYSTPEELREIVETAISERVV